MAWRFIHIPRTGGTSFEDAYGLSDVPELAKPHCHTPASRFPEGVTLFAMVRNPWDRAVSIYSYLSQSGGLKGMTFTQWVLDGQCATGGWKGPAGMSLSDPQVAFADRKSVQLFRFEDYETEVQRIAELIGEPAVGIGRHHASQHAHWLDYYEGDGFEEIRKIYREDVALWNSL